MRLRRALGEYVIEGIDTTIPLFLRLLEQPEIIDGEYDIHWLENFPVQAGAKRLRRAQNHSPTLKTGC
jgi:biotin carboxylase